MSRMPFDDQIEPAADIDSAALWAGSGCQWISPAIEVPDSLVRRLVGTVRALDARGAGLAEMSTAGGLGLLAERAASMRLPPGGAVSVGGASRFVRCMDGHIVLSLARDGDRELLPAWLEASVGPGDPWVTVELHAADRSVDELVERAVLLGLPCSAVGEVTDPVRAYVHGLGAARSRSVEGAIVVNLAALWAGPLCADVLARMGARVITVESTRRPDGGRLAKRFFDSLHGRSESVALDLAGPDGRRRLRELLAMADIVIEGSRPRALEQMGIVAEDLVADGPQVWLSITSHGRREPYAGRVGFGDDAAVAGGLVGGSADAPRFVADAVADPLTGLTAAWVGSQLLGRGGRWLADIALARVARSVVGPWLPVDATAVVERPRARSDRGSPLPLGRDTDAVLARFSID